MKKKLKLKGQLRSYMQWPIMLTVLLAAMNLWIYVMDVRIGMVMSVFIGIYVVTVIILYVYNKPLILNELISFATQYGQVQKSLLKELAVPYALLDDQGKMVWRNEAFMDVVGADNARKKSIFAILPELHREDMPDEEGVKSCHIHYEDRDFRADFRKITIDGMLENNSLVDTIDYEGYLVALYLFDETDLNIAIRENREQRMVSGLIYIDNYDEALESIEEVRQSLLGALIERKINKYIAGVEGIVKKLEKDKYFVIFKYKYLRQLKEQRFDIMDDVKTVNIGNEMPITLSIGIGIGGSTYAQNYEYARTAIDLALGRGGDQAVLKEGSSISYYGGKSKTVEKTTRVKARVKAQALREIIQTKDRVIIMGHKLSDVDAFGAAVGIYRASVFLNKKVNIVVNEVTTSLRPLMDSFLAGQDKAEDIVIKSPQAIERADGSTVVVVVDTNRPSYTECQELLNKCKTIVVLDHHRRGGEVIENATLSYIEPYASSACEMVAEILQYFDDGLKIKQSEADCLYAGIMIDTDNFMSKAGVRTFEAAAFLKRSGADITRIRKLLRYDMTEYKASAEVVRKAEIYQGVFAISVCEGDGLESPTIVGAQAANELLDIIGVKASFVLTQYNHTIYVSARAIDEVNVQIIMERLGGGGHMTIAGAQLGDVTLDEAKSILKETLNKMQEEGAL